MLYYSIMIFWIVILVVIVISFILYKCFSVFDNILDDAKKDPEKFTNFINGKSNIVENFDNGDSLINDKCSSPIIFSSPSTVSIPANESIPITYTGGNYNDKKKPENGRYCFPISKFLYDGIWDRNVINLKKGYQENLWTLPKKDIVENNYCTNKFMHLPEKTFVNNETYVDNNEDCNYNVNLEMNCCY